MIVVFTDAAEADLENISDYIARKNPQSAVTFVDKLVERCRSLAGMPDRFPLLSRDPQKRIRRLVHRNYLIFYVVLHERVDILHILNGARDYEAILFSFDDEPL